MFMYMIVNFLVVVMINIKSFKSKMGTSIIETKMHNRKLGESVSENSI